MEHGFKLCDIARLGVQGGQLNAECKSMVSLVNVDIASYQTNSWPRLLEICCCFSQMLVKSVSGFLRAQGIVIQRSRVREALHYVDPYGVQLRRRRVLLGVNTMFQTLTLCGMWILTTNSFAGWYPISGWHPTTQLSLHLEHFKVWRVWITFESTK